MAVKPTHEELGKKVKGLEKEVSDSKRAEDVIEKFFEQPMNLHIIAGLDGKIHRVNRGWGTFLGYSNEEIEGTFFYDLVHPDDLDSTIKEMGKLGKGVTTFYFENRYRHKNGSYRFLAWSAIASLDDQLVYAVASDFTDRIRAEAALRESEEKFRRLVENALVGVYQIEEGGKFIMANRKMAEMFGYDSPESLIASVDNIANLYARPEERPVILKDIDAKGSVSGKTLEFRKKDGKSLWGKIHTKVIREEEKTIYEGLMEDITESKLAKEERKKLEDRLHRAQKMEAMGLMAGGVAHDLNNILSGIVSYPELLLMDLPEESPLRKPLETIQESGMRAADVVEDLLTIARGIATGKETLNLNTILSEYLGTPEFQELEKTHSFVDFKTELDPDLLNMSGSPTHIKKVLTNLVTNASEAIEVSGTVTLSTENRYMDEPVKGYEDVHQGEYALLSISDEGTGISQKDLDRIFEPFYTKKVMGRSGTGLGLAVVWNTVQDHNGYINVNTSEKGTVFELYFPVTREEMVAEQEGVPLEDYLGHGEKILVIDDEERQREIASGILTRLGYKAEAVSSGEEAIEYVKEHPVDLILLDMVMPKGINGRKTYEEIIKIRPAQKAIIASGYAKTREVDLAQELGAGKYIKKPYTLSKVGLAVKEELEK
ncbi:MAG: PAS domain S-box protein [Deltaproteobacteria bacterium]|uniref:histidine kinase n=1 Tax=Candidatus Desulfacyla euxinica TaxID=2841693 RepID=A0A8J6T6J4_9DELT|nr:PAS domain S-box protein [Candidatus Desulfacyla euxinica]